MRPNRASLVASGNVEPPPAFTLAAQPIRPLARSGARYSRLPWSEILLRPLDGTDPESFVSDRYREATAALDLQVLREAVSGMRRHMHYAINMSARTLASHAACTAAVELFAAAGISTAKIVFEIVDRDALVNTSAAALMLSVPALKKKGITLAIDDLQPDEHPVFHELADQFDYVKLDLAATTRLCAEGSLPIGLQRSLRHFPRAECVCEGIETLEMLAAVTRLSHARYWQGFFDDGHPRPLIPTLSAA